VSLAVWVRGDKQSFTLGNMVIYWIVQLAAGFVAALAVTYIKGAMAASLGEQISITPNNVSAYLIPSLVAEFLGTFALTFTVLNVATAKATSGNSFYGWAIGMAVLASAYAFGSITGGAFNPAVALGVTVIGGSSWNNIWIFLIPQLLAAVIAAFVFRAAHPGE
jgi:aquaporin Z